MHKTPAIKSFSLLVILRNWAFLICVISAQSALGQAFFNSVEDLPLAPGLVEELDQGVIFESPGGRIVTSVAYGGDGVTVYREFYKETLPALGWEWQADGTYHRGNETLRIDFQAHDHRTEVKLRMVPTRLKKSP